MCIEDSEVIVLKNSSQQTRRSATVKAPFVQCRAIRHSGTSDALSSSKPLRFTNKQTNKQTLLLYRRRQPIANAVSPDIRRTCWAPTLQSLSKNCARFVSHIGDEDLLFGDVTLSSKVVFPDFSKERSAFICKNLEVQRNITWRRRHWMPSKRGQTPSHRRCHFSQYLRAAEACWRQHINRKNTLLLSHFITTWCYKQNRQVHCSSHAGIVSSISEAAFRIPHTHSDTGRAVSGGNMSHTHGVNPLQISQFIARLSSPIHSS